MVCAPLSRRLRMFAPQWPAGRQIAFCAVFVTGMLAGNADSLSVAAADSGDKAIPDFAIGNGVAWREIGDEFLPPSSRAGAVTEDALHPFRSNGAVRQGLDPTYHIGDISSPILQPW